MRRVFKFLAWAFVAVILLGAAVLADLLFNGQRLTATLMGGDKVEAACLPVLADDLRAAGYEPRDLQMGESRAFSYSSWSGRSLQGDFSFQDGAAGARVDGIMACALHDGAAKVEFRTRSSPVRAT